MLFCFHTLHSHPSSNTLTTENMGEVTNNKIMNKDILSFNINGTGINKQILLDMNFSKRISFFAYTDFIPAYIGCGFTSAQH